MTDDEVLTWLSAEEKAMWATEDAWHESQDCPVASPRAALRSLAAARAALASVEWEGIQWMNELPCCVFPGCAVPKGEPHKNGCTLATMPRPKGP